MFIRTHQQFDQGEAVLYHQVSFFRIFLLHNFFSFHTCDYKTKFLLVYNYIQIEKKNKWQTEKNLYFLQKFYRFCLKKSVEQNKWSHSSVIRWCMAQVGCVPSQHQYDMGARWKHSSNRAGVSSRSVPYSAASFRTISCRIVISAVLISAFDVKTFRNRIVNFCSILSPAD